MPSILKDSTLYKMAIKLGILIGYTCISVDLTHKLEKGFQDIQSDTIWHILIAMILGILNLFSTLYICTTPGRFYRPARTSSWARVDLPEQNPNNNDRCRRNTGLSSKIGWILMMIWLWAPINGWYTYSVIQILRIHYKKFLNDTFDVVASFSIGIVWMNYVIDFFSIYPCVLCVIKCWNSLLNEVEAGDTPSSIVSSHMYVEMNRLPIQGELPAHRVSV